MPPKIVAIHFPKAAGSSLKQQFLDLLGDKVALDYDHDPLIPAGNETADFPKGKSIVMGHFRAQRYASANACWITFLRHPVDTLISIYFFWKVFPESHALHARFLREKPSILDFAVYPGIRNLMSERYFGGFDMARFDFIGFHENRGGDFPRLAEVLDLPVSCAVHENPTRPSEERRDLEANASMRRRLTDLLAADVAFYEKLHRRHPHKP